MQVARNMVETGVNFIGLLTASDIREINKGTKQPIRNEPGKTEVLVSTNLLGPVTPMACGNYGFMVNCADHFTKFKAVCFISEKDKALTTLVKYVQDLVMPLGLRLLHLRGDSVGDFIVD